MTRREAITLLGTSLITRPARLRGSAGSQPLFDVVPPSKSGITWTHENAMSDMRWLPETMGPGCAFLDYDNDGWMDVYLVNSGSCDFWNPSKPLRNALYRNNRDGTFTDVTERAGLAGRDFGMGVAVGDYNNDGYPDLLITAYGRPSLYRNSGDGTFTDVTERAGLGSIPSSWTTSAAWFDFDGNGLLDLFICSFVEFSKDRRHSCGLNATGRHYYCYPKAFAPTPSLLYRNNGDGTFTEVGCKSAIGKAMGKALGVVACDIDNDSRMDLYVVSDTAQDFIFRNKGAGKDGTVEWEEIGLESGVGLSESGNVRSSMGADAGDFDGDGSIDLFVSNVDKETYSLYRNNKDGTFTDVGVQNGVAQTTRLMSGWGLKFFDYDNDGNPDLLIVNGHPDDMIAKYSPMVSYREALLLFHNDRGKLRNVSQAAGPVFQEDLAARGLAIGDFNNDGKLDALVGVNGGAPLLLKNTCPSGNNWIGLKLEGMRANRDGIGAVIRWSADGVPRSRQKTGGGSYLSAHDPREVLGLGTAKSVDWIEIRWPAPSGLVQRITAPLVNRYITIVEGKSV